MSEIVDPMVPERLDYDLAGHDARELGTFVKLFLSELNSGIATHFAGALDHYVVVHSHETNGAMLARAFLSEQNARRYALRLCSQMAPCAPDQMREHAVIFHDWKRVERFIPSQVIKENAE